MSSPDLFIIAGPNGSGKSLFSKELAITDLEIFDGDKHMAVLVKKYPAWVQPVLDKFQDFVLE
jgi:predicted ABC-type ATPase